MILTLFVLYVLYHICSSGRTLEGTLKMLAVYLGILLLSFMLGGVFGTSITTIILIGFSALIKSKTYKENVQEGKRINIWVGLLVILLVIIAIFFMQILPMLMYMEF